MKIVRFLGLVAVCGHAALWAQGFRTGQAARLTMGQPTFTAQLPGASEQRLGAVSGLAYANDTLFVADASRVGASPDNHRVLLFRNLSSQIPPPDAALENDTRCPACVGKADVVVGQPDFTKTELALSQTGMRLPTSVATDGRYMAVADTDNNRILIYNQIPTTNGARADIVVGQESFTTIKRPTTDQRSLRGPQGVWIHEGRLFVADTLNHRVLIWNRIPTANNAPADVVLGRADFTSQPPVGLLDQLKEVSRNTLLNPVSVSTDGRRLYVADLGHNRVMIWNTIPTQNGQAADIVLGQKDFISVQANNSKELCASNGTDENGNATYPARCAATLSFPRFVLPAGPRLFIADGGNDRVLVYNTPPLLNAQPADAVLGQIDETFNLTSDSAFPERVSASDTLRTPTSLAWDGTNLYVSDTFNRRILVFTPGLHKVALTGVRNAFSREIFAVGNVAFGGTPKENDEVTLKIQEKEYKYKCPKDCKVADAVRDLADQVNTKDGGDPSAIALPVIVEPILYVVQLTARVAGAAGNEITLSATVANTDTAVTAGLTATASGANLGGGQEAANLAPGSLLTIFGEDLCDDTIAIEPNQILPLELGGVQVYIDGIRIPIVSVSPTEIVAQMPWEVIDTTSTNAFVRTLRKDGRLEVTSAVAVPIIQQNPGILAAQGEDPRPGVVLHGSSFGTGTVSVDGTAQENDVATIRIRDRAYSYTVKKDDTLEGIRDGLINAINAGDGDPEVVAFSAGVFTRIRLQARVPGPAGNGIPFTTDVATGANVILTGTNSETCCANIEDAPVTEENPAVPGETIKIWATGLGLIEPKEASDTIVNGFPYSGPVPNNPVEFVSSLAGGKTANVLFAQLQPGLVGIYLCVLELNTDIPTNPVTQLTIAQSFQVSNIVTFPVYKDEAPTP
jgi:hypothetical protein